MKRTIFGIVALSTLVGCHGRYKRNAESLGKVKVVVRAPSGPVVSHDDGFDAQPEDASAVQVAAEVGMEVATVVLGQKAQRKLDKAMPSAEARELMKASFMDDVDGQRLPYKVGEKGRARMIIEITDFGLDASSGQPAAFVQTKTTIEDKTGKKVYRATERCIRTLGPGMDIPFTGADELAAMKQLADLSPKKMDKVLTALVEQCATEVADELVDHL